METREQAQAALLTALVGLIGKASTCRWIGMWIGSRLMRETSTMRGGR